MDFVKKDMETIGIKVGEVDNQRWHLIKGTAETSKLQIPKKKVTFTCFDQSRPIKYVMTCMPDLC